MFSLNGKTALITGSGRGIGLAIAEAMAHQGANIFLSDINSSVVERAAGELAGKYPNVAVRGLTFDVTDKAQIESAMQTIKDAGNGLQILVNNAGINLREPVADMDDALWQKMLDTNLTSVFRVSRAAFPMLKEKGGKVINLVLADVRNRASHGIALREHQGCGTPVHTGAGNGMGGTQHSGQRHCAGLYRHGHEHPAHGRQGSQRLHHAAYPGETLGQAVPKWLRWRPSSPRPRRIS